MALLKRALNKAYLPSPPEPVQPPDELETPAMLRGWLDEVRQPRRTRGLSQDVVAAGDVRRVPGTMTTGTLPVADLLSAGRANHHGEPEQRFDEVLPESMECVDAGESSEATPAEKLTGPALARVADVIEFESPGNERTDPIVVRVQSSPLENWEWPGICRQLGDGTDSGFLPLAERLCEQARAADQKCIVFTSNSRRAGRTSILLTLARALVEHTESAVTLVDADIEHRSIAELLESEPNAAPVLRLHCPAATPSEDVTPLEPQDRATQPEEPQLADLAGAAVTLQQHCLVPDRLSLLSAPRNSDLDQHQRAHVWEALISEISRMRAPQHLVLVDGGRWDLLCDRLLDTTLPRAIDAVICVERHGRGEQAEFGTEEISRTCAAAGLPFLGVIETFAPPPTVSNRGTELNAHSDSPAPGQN